VVRWDFRARKSDLTAADCLGFRHYCELLKEWGFTPAQQVLITNAMEGAGLESQPQ
jgi:hypothetical protein